MRELRRAAEPPGQLGQHDPRLLLLLGQLISLPCQKSADCFVRKDRAQACFAVNVDQELVRPHTAFQHPDAEALAGQLLVPAAHAAGKVHAVPRFIAEQPCRLEPGQYRGALLDHHGFKISLHVRSPSSGAFFQGYRSPVPCLLCGRWLESANQNAEKNAAGPCLAASWLVISNVALSYHRFEWLSTGFRKVFQAF